MSKAQEAFRAVIEAGYYPVVGGRGSPYMCMALVAARANGVITDDQRKAGRSAIQSTLADLDRTNSMAEAMLGRGTSVWEDRRWAIEHGVELYMNWDERVETLEFPEWVEDDDDYHW